MVANRNIGPAMREERQAPVISADKVSKSLDDRINKLRKSTEVMQAEIQSLIVDISKHCVGQGNGDITRAAKLVDALPRWFRRADLIRYWGMFSPVTIVKDTKTEGLMRASLRKDDRETNKESKFVPWNIPWAEVPENSFFNYIAGLKEPGFLTFEDAEAQVIMLAERLQKKLDSKVKEVPDDMPAEQALKLLSDDDRAKNVTVVRENEANNIRKLIGGLKKLHNEYKPKAVTQQTAPEVEEVQRESAAA